MRKKGTLIIAILLMAIGFAAISTTLIINGNARVSENPDDFSVIFTKASLDNIDVYNEIISQDKKTITFTSKDLKKINDTSVLNYEITNNSANYDAEVKVNCKVKDNTEAKYTSIKNELENNATVVKAKETLNGTLTVTLEKSATEEVKEEYICTLEFNAVERDELGKHTPVITKTGENIGDGVCIDDECFYIYGYENNNVKLLSKYNLYVGGSYDGTNYTLYEENATGLQNSKMIGANENYPYEGVIEYSNDNQKGTYYNTYKGSLVEKYVEEYRQKITSDKYPIGENDVRILTKDELTTLGCNFSTLVCSGYSWAYSTSFWTMTVSPFTSTGEHLYYVKTGSTNIGIYGYPEKTSVGIRPVIIIPKNYIE